MIKRPWSICLPSWPAAWQTPRGGSPFVPSQPVLRSSLSWPVEPCCYLPIRLAENAASSCSGPIVHCFTTGLPLSGDAGPVSPADWRSTVIDRCVAGKLLDPVRLRHLLDPTGQIPRRPVLAQRRLVHDPVPRPLQIFDRPLGSDLRLHLVRVVHALPAVEAEGEGQRLRDFVAGGGAQRGRVWHGDRL